jgi:predicted CXXCH cytochrome family protein
MRQYDLPTDQLAKYRESQHGLVLATGDTKVATCFDCHDGHATREVNDPTASVYPSNVPELCAGCHSDEAYMAGYDIPTNQFELYESSVHGIALLEQQDTRAPSCATCHGTHGAAPPGFDEVANVCGSCHAATQDYYLSSVHNSDNPDAPDCVSCHGRYDVEQPGEHMFTGSEPRHCGSCHESSSDEGEIVSAMYDALVGADEAYTHASETVEQAARLGRIVTREESLLAEARTRLITARAAQHTVDLDIVMQQTDSSVDLSDEANTNAEEAISASQFRRMMMGIVVAAIILVIISLSWLRRELSAANREQEQ